MIAAVKNPGRSGFTLVEMVISLSVISILMVTVTAALHFVLMATASGSTAVTPAIDGSLLSEEIAGDLEFACNFTDRTATAATFTVPDRDGDGQPEQIRYAWWPSGNALVTPAIPVNAVTRQTNGGAPVVIASDVRQFSLSYVLRTMTPASVSSPLPVVALSTVDPTSGTMREYFPSDKNWVAQTFRPPVPAGTTSWALTRVSLKCRSDITYDGIVKVQIRTADSSNRPTTTVLEEVTVPELSLADVASWIDVPFRTLNNLSPTQTLALVIVGVSGTSYYSAFGYVNNGTPMPANSYFTSTANAGNAWQNPNIGNSLNYILYGRTTP